MAKVPLISIILTNYNYGEYVGKAIDSVLSQTYGNIELIVINDGSTDDSDKRIKEYVKKNPQIIYKNQKNMGANKTRNKGIELAAGEYVFLLDADNWLNPNHIEVLYRALVKENADVVYGDLQCFGEHDFKYSAPEFDIEYLKIQNYIDTSSLIRKKSIGGNRFDAWLNRRFLQDYDFFLGLALKGLVFTKCSDASLNYRVHGKQNGHRPDDVSKTGKLIENYTYIVDKYKKLYPKAYNQTIVLANELFVRLQREKMQLQYRIVETTEQNIKLASEVDNLRFMNNELLNSTSWRITEPLRKVRSKIKSKGSKEIE